jgi:mRNA interferase MazF
MLHKGDVYWVDFEPGRGVEQAGRRPALVIQNNRGNRSSPYTVVAALSTAPLPRVYPFTVRVDPGEANLKENTHVNCAQLTTIDKERLLDYIGTLSDETMTRVDNALLYEFDLATRSLS